GQADAEACEEDHRNGDARVVFEEARRQVRRQADDRAHRQVHVPADDDHRLAEREQCEGGRVDQHELDVRGVQEAGLDARGDQDEQDEDHQDAGFPDPEDALGEAGVPRAACLLLAAWQGGGAHRAPSCCPMAADMSASSEASAWLNSATSAPSRITRMRSLTPSTSGSSEEIIKMATPSRARSVSRLCTSALVPTSMPRVGSSTISTVGFRPSHLASTTFCWLPPLSMATGSVSRPYLIFSRLPQSVAIARSALERIRPPLRSAPREARATFCWIDMSMTRPCCRRSSGTNPTPAVIALTGDAFLSCLPRTVTWP